MRHSCVQISAIFAACLVRPTPFRNPFRALNLQHSKSVESSGLRVESGEQYQAVDASTMNESCRKCIENQKANDMVNTHGDEVVGLDALVVGSKLKDVEVYATEVGVSGREPAIVSLSPDISIEGSRV